MKLEQNNFSGTEVIEKYDTFVSWEAIQGEYDKQPQISRGVYIDIAPEPPFETACTR